MKMLMLMLLVLPIVYSQSDVCCYDTSANNPCTPENIEADMMYFPACSGCAHFIQCDASGMAYDMMCQTGTIWNGEACAMGSECGNLVTCSDVCWTLITGTEVDNQGDLVITNSSGETLVDGYFAQGVPVMNNFCVDASESLMVQTEGPNAWAGTIEAHYESDGSAVPLVCDGCTGQVQGVTSIVVDGNSDGVSLAPTRCLNGEICTLHVGGSTSSYMEGLNMEEDHHSEEPCPVSHMEEHMHDTLHDLEGLIQMLHLQELAITSLQDSMAALQETNRMMLTQLEDKIQEMHNLVDQSEPSAMREVARESSETTTLSPLQEFCKEACQEGVGGPECNCATHPIG